MSRIYFDHAATASMVPEAVEAMTRELARVGNASSLHAFGALSAAGGGGVARSNSGSAWRQSGGIDLHQRRDRV